MLVVEETQRETSVDKKAENVSIEIFTISEDIQSHHSHESRPE